MSSTVEVPTVPPRSRRRWRVPGIVIATAVLVGVAGLFAAPGQRADLDPTSPRPEASLALARILAEHGVRVDLVRHADDVRADPDATVLVANPDLVPYDVLVDLDENAGDLVLVQPGSAALDAISGWATVGGRAPALDAEPGCRDPDAREIGRVRAGGRLYVGNDPCYPVTGDAKGGDRLTGTLVRVTVGDQTRVALGQPDVLRNRYLADQGNAALAIRLLGRHPVLQWYLPDPLEADPDSVAGPLDLIPGRVWWLAVQLVIAALVAMLWRARRLGPLVGEPLPVVVRSAETAEGRARLYRRAGARARAAATLRTATLRRLARRVGDADGTPEGLARRVAATTGRTDAPDVLLGSAPRDDAALVRLANHLDDLERDVARPGPAAGRPTTDRTATDRTATDRTNHEDAR